MYLLDTNIVSELRRPRPHPRVVAWLKATDDAHLHVSAMIAATALTNNLTVVTRNVNDFARFQVQVLSS
jgi:predicted nucleic acid-binding protein